MKRGGVDSWLGRLSHVSQILLCIFSAWALYFTVIPLYRIATLEKTIAQRESELEEKNLELANAKAQIEEVNVELYKRRRDDYLQGLVMGDLLACTEPQIFSLPAHGVDFDPYKVVVDRVYSKCVSESFDLGKAREYLDERDVEVLSDAVEAVKSRLAGMRETVIDDMRTLESRARKDKTILKDRGPFSEELDRIFSSLGVGYSSEEEAFKQAVSSTADSMAMEYGAAVHSEILRLRVIKWVD